MSKRQKENVTSRSRIKSISTWIKDENPDFIREINNSLVATNIYTSFELFKKNISTLGNIYYYAIEKSIERQGDSFLKKLFYYLFGHRVVEPKKDEPIGQQKIKRFVHQEERQYNKVVENNIELVFVKSKTGFILRGRDVVTKRFIDDEKIKKYKRS